MHTFNNLSLSNLVIVLGEIEQSMEVKRGGSAHRLLARFARISDPDNIELARYGIERHLYYCEKAGTAYDIHAIAEIITDAQNGESIARDNERDIAQARYLPIDIAVLSSGLIAHKPAMATRKRAILAAC